MALFLDGEATFSYPLDGWGYSEVGGGRGGRPDVADLAPSATWSGASGATASHAVLPAERLVGHLLPAGLDPIVGTFARVGAVALNAVLAADIHLGEQVAVFGQGVIGLLATQRWPAAGRARCSPSTPCRPAGAGRSSSAPPTVRRAARGSSPLTDARADRGPRRRPGDRAERRLPGPARGDPRAPGVGGRVVAAGFYQGDGARRCASARSSTTTGCSSSPPRSAACRLARRPLDAGAAAATVMEAVRRGRHRSAAAGQPRAAGPWSAADAYQLIDEPPPTCSRSSWTSTESTSEAPSDWRSRSSTCAAARMMQMGARASGSASTPSSCAERGDLPLRGPAARAQARRLRPGCRCPRCAWRCCTSSATSTPASAPTRCAQLTSQLCVIAEIGGRLAMTPASYGMFSARLPPFVPPRSAEDDHDVLLEALRPAGGARASARA